MRHPHNQEAHKVLEDMGLGARGNLAVQAHNRAEVHNRGHLVLHILHLELEDKELEQI